VAQGIGPEFKSQYHKKKKKEYDEKGKKERFNLKTGAVAQVNMAQVLSLLPSSHEALGLISSTTNKQTNKQNTPHIQAHL
jgi:hypothetical protein